MKRKERLVLSIVALILVASMILTACAPAPAPAPAQQPAAAAATTAPAAAEPTKAPAAAAAKPFPTENITLSIWGGFPEIQPVYEKAAAEYKKLHPNVTINVLTAPLREFEQKMAATIPADSAGDILEANPFALNKFIAAGMLPPVPDDIVQWMTAQGRFSDALVNNNKLKDKYYGVPYLVGRHAIYYNTDMFAAAGLPNGPQTMDDLRNFAKKLVKTDAAGTMTNSGVSMRLSGAGSGVAEKFWMYLYPMGGSIIEQTKSGKWHNNYDNEAGLNTLQMYMDIVWKDKTDNHQIKHDTEAFQLGQTAMYARESSVIGSIAKNAPNLKYATVPMPKGVRWGDLANGENLYVTKNSKYPEVAWDVVKFLQSDAMLQELLKVSGWLPQRQDADLKAILDSQPAYKSFLFSDPNYKLFVYPMLPEYDEIQTKMAERLVKIYLDEKLANDPVALKKALSEMAKETDDILKRNNNYGTD